MRHPDGDPLYIEEDTPSDDWLDAYDEEWLRRYREWERKPHAVIVPPVQESISPGLAALLAGMCYGFVLGIVFTVVVRAVLG